MNKKEDQARDRFAAALQNDAVKKAASALRDAGGEPSLVGMLELGRALAGACEDLETAARLDAELNGYQDSELDVPEERRALGFASSFPVRALDLGLLEPEEIFLANREKFSQVTLTIGQPIQELQEALAQLKQGGVLALKVPASEITGESANTDEDTEVYIYILPREIQRIVDAARGRALSAVVSRIIDAAV